MRILCHYTIYIGVLCLKLARLRHVFGFGVQAQFFGFGVQAQFFGFGVQAQLCYNKCMAKTGNLFESFVKIVKKLRNKCPWDREQTFDSLKPYLVEEVYEALQAIDDKDFAKLSEELGDMLLHVVMLANMAEEKKRFSIKDVIKTIEEKMIRRHPHVFGDIRAKNADEVLMRWERIKQKEAKEKAAKHKGIFESIPRTLPALYRAQKVQKRAARFGFDWDKVAGAWEKVYEELEEVHDLLSLKVKTSLDSARDKKKLKPKLKTKKIKEEIGDLLFAIVNVARKLEIDAEDAMQQASSKFTRRFSKIEKKLHNKKMTLKQMDDLWNKVKASET